LGCRHSAGTAPARRTKKTKKEVESAAKKKKKQRKLVLVAVAVARTEGAPPRQDALLLCGSH
jgi:hypothetical protein